MKLSLVFASLVAVVAAHDRHHCDGCSGHRPCGSSHPGWHDNNCNRPCKRQVGQDNTIAQLPADNSDLFASQAPQGLDNNVQFPADNTGGVSAQGPAGANNNGQFPSTDVPNNGQFPSTDALNNGQFPSNNGLNNGQFPPNNSFDNSQLPSNDGFDSQQPASDNEDDLPLATNTAEQPAGQQQTQTLPSTIFDDLPGFLGITFPGQVDSSATILAETADNDGEEEAPTSDAERVDQGLPSADDSAQNTSTGGPVFPRHMEAIVVALLFSTVIF
ncbi:hypothetical protein IWW50_006983 [Coemansia erecta]|nr:hypothetical protein GGF43_004064 [Coemansia sp. RSA 2618]KAJ2814925.1 hypothetical protein IWW50_006983 [Coemansia erecta]